MEDIVVNFEFTPLGNVKIEWQVPISLIKEKDSIEIEVPGYKYDLPTFGTIPVPFSSKAFPLNFKFGKLPDKAICEIRDGVYGNKILIVNIREMSESQENFVFSYEIENIMNNDGIYFVSVYPFRSPFFGVNHGIVIKAKYSYNIRIYRFWERYFSYPDNKSLKRKLKFKSIKSGDETVVTGSIKPEYNVTLDLHLTGTRFPILIRRDIFWMAIFIIIILVFLSPYLVEFFKLFIGK